MNSTRRTLLCTGLGVTAASAFRTTSVTTPARADSFDRPPVDGEFSHEANVRAAAADDFGHIVYKLPRAVLKPLSSADISSLMHWASKKELKVVARGRGHSTYGRALTDGGVVVDMSTMSSIRQILPDRIVVDAGATWKSVLEATLAQGLTPPVLTNYLGLSVGGTIAVGGIGGTSSRYGMQTDHVLSLDLVTGNGEELTCSATSHPDLFDAARAGLAQCGIITRATLRLRRAPERVRRFQLFYPDLACLTADQRQALAEDRFDQLQGALLPHGASGWRYQLEGAVFYDRSHGFDDKALLASLSHDRSAAVVTDLTYRDDVYAFAKLAKMLKSTGQWSNPQPWLFTFLRGSNAEQLASEVLGGPSGEKLGPSGRITYYPMRTGAFRTPLVRLPDEDVVFPFNIIRIPASNDAAQTEQAVAQNRVLYDRVRNAGGVQYPVSALPMSSDDWKDHFGSMWSMLRDAKRRYDPLGTLTPGYNVF